LKQENKVIFLSTLNLDLVVYEGALLKYKPGSNFCWIERWCVLTKHHFLYYKNQWSAYCWDMKPLLILSIKDIHDVLTVSLKLPEVGKKKALTSDKKTYTELFQFEIFNELTDYPYDQEVLGSVSDRESAFGQTPKFQVEGLHGYQLWGQYEQEKRRKEAEAGKAKKVPFLTHI
jgi:PH domain